MYSPIKCNGNTEEVVSLLQEKELFCGRLSKDTSAEKIEKKCFQKANDICHQNCCSCLTSSPTPETIIPTYNPIECKYRTEEVTLIRQEE